MLVIAPPCQSESAEIDVKNELLSRLQKMSLKSAVEEVTALSGLSKKEVYNQALALKDKK